MGEKKAHRIPENQPAKIGDTISEVLAQLKAGQARGGDPSTPAAHQALEALKGLPDPVRLPGEAPRLPGTPPEGLESFFAEMEAYLRRQGERLKGLSPKARRVYDHLLTTGLLRLLAVKPNPSRAVKQVSTFAPIGILAKAVGIPRRTLHRVLKELKRAGLVDWRAWRTQATVKGRQGVYKAGVVYAVKLPDRPGRAQVYPEDLREAWRDLDRDIAEGRTAYAEERAWREETAEKRSRRAKKAPRSTLAQYREEDRLDRKGVELLLTWSKALTPVGLLFSISLYGAKKAAGELLARLLGQKSAFRRQAVEGLAKELAEELKDPRGFRFYAWAIWQALRAAHYSQRTDVMEGLLWAIRRAWEAMAAGSIRRPGALVVHLLKTQGLFDLLREYPAWRVA